MGGPSTRGRCPSGPALVFRPAVGLLRSLLLPPDVSHPNRPRLGAVVHRGAREEPRWSARSCLSPGWLSILAQPRCHLTGSAGAVGLGTLGRHVIDPAAFRQRALGCLWLCGFLWVASLQALLWAGEAAAAAALDQHHALGQPWHLLSGGAGAAGLSTQQWHAVEPNGFYCLAAQVLGSLSPWTASSLVLPGLSGEAAPAVRICPCQVTQWCEHLHRAQEMSLQDCLQGPAASLLGWLEGRWAWAHCWPERGGTLLWGHSVELLLPLALLCQLWGGRRGSHLAPSQGDP